SAVAGSAVGSARSDDVHQQHPVARQRQTNHRAHAGHDSRHLLDDHGAPGRMILAQELPLHPNVPFTLINRVLRKKEITEVIDAVYRHCGQKETVIFCDHVMSLGFKFSTIAGISFGKDDLVIPKSKEKMVKDTELQVKEFEQQYQDGLITRGEKYNKVVDAWS